MNSDRQFDPNFATRLLLDIAHEQSVEHLLQRLVHSAMEHPVVVCAQTWLLEKGDRCSACPQRPGCSDQTRCLHLAASGYKTFSDSGADVPRFEHPNARMPLGVGLVGKVAATGQQIIIRAPVAGLGELAQLDGLEQERIRGFSGSPITFKGEVLGVTCVFVLSAIPEDALPWGQIFADHIGAAIANARAFEEIQRLRAQLQEQNTYLLEEVVEARAFGDLVGQSAALRQIVSQIDLVAPTEASVLILGDTGTGKDLVAYEIHHRSRRKDRPMVRVNCASIPKELFESEFFGHVKGAFTGAIRDRPGRFETADGGTLFLDEIGEVPLDMQGKLLRVLQEKRYERVGDDLTRQADVRIIGATNRDLKKEVAAGRFREDLYYRLHVFPIYVAALKERKEDIPLLARHFVELSVKGLRCPKPRLTRAAVAGLQDYDWPGNVRELRNVIERGVILARGGPLHFDLPVTDPAPAPASPSPYSAAKAGLKYLTEGEMRRRQRENVVAVLESAGWKIKGADGAAELLGVRPTTLLSRMKKMGIKRPGK
ncbi:MAG: sigma 54-interacting transcriptional regulator [Limisphaerales bacterium]